jgi:large subunit ribosomal protein L6
MSRIASSPVRLPSGVEVSFKGREVSAKGKNGTLAMIVHESVEVVQENGELHCSARDNAQQSIALAGTMRALLNNLVTGVAEGFEKKLQLNGVGYRAKATGKTLNLTLGFSHPIDYVLPESVSAETPTQTEIVLKSANKQLLGQVAAEIRGFRAPEPYKGKGIRYADEQVLRKEAKKK